MRSKGTILLSGDVRRTLRGLSSDANSNLFLKKHHRDRLPGLKNNMTFYNLAKIQAWFKYVHIYVNSNESRFLKMSTSKATYQVVCFFGGGSISGVPKFFVLFFIIPIASAW